MSEMNFDVLEKAFFQNANVNVNDVAVLAEDVQTGSGVSWDTIFFEPQPGENWLIKFVTNIKGEPITHRKMYRTLPDPKRKGKNFHYVSSGQASTCPVLNLFFDLNKDKKNGDVLAEQKIENFLGQSNQACVVVQLLDGPRPELINQFRLFIFSTFGPNPEIANLIKKKLSPDESMQKLGIEPMNIFDVFGSHILMLKCEETEYKGNKGRGYGKSDWVTTKNFGVKVPFEKEDGTVTYVELKETDKVLDSSGNVIGVKEEAKPVFKKLLEILQQDNLSVHNYFSYKAPDDPKNSEEVNKYITEVFEKVNEIVPIIRNATSIAEIKNYGIAQTQQEDSATIINGKSKQDILKESMPTELNDIVKEENSKETKTSEPTSTEDIMKSIGIK